jgi:hypothetical protein
MKDIAILSERDVAALLESIDDLRDLLARIVDRTSIGIPEPDDSHPQDSRLSDLF